MPSDSPRDEVRAGPGDAGASDAPRALPETPQDRRTKRNATPFAAAVVAVGVAMVALWWAIT
ncbi:hypothetical protein DXV76_14440 [Rhodobacteraceae bacterium CCMM004]|nr:hypothetical protein DXV76_14440 [Rhodobacteraceae bacterium CCMM004]